MTPQYPSPGQTVTLTAVNYSSGADTATYIWSVNNAIVLQGIGAKTLTLSAGAAGSSQAISLLVVQNGAAEGAASAVIRPADVDMVWEGETSVPPFYTGRPLPNGQSALTVMAVPHIRTSSGEVPQNSLVYTWKVNGAPLGSQSGYARSSVVISPPSFNQAFTVSVHAQTPDGTGAADGATTIQPETPSALVYESAPLLGVLFNETVSGTVPFPGDELSFAAFPLFSGDLAALTSAWTLDGGAFSVDPSKPLDVTFRKTGSVSGSHPVTFSFTNAGAFLEHGGTTFTLSF